MGVKAMAWAFEQPLAGNEKVILLALANRARDEDFLCFPGQKEIARQACVSEKTVNRILAKLEERGYITRTQRRRDDGGRTSDLIRLREEGPPDKVSVDTSDQGAPDTAVSVQEPSMGTTSSLFGRGRAASNGPKGVSYQGRSVPPVVVELATALLAHFNEGAGRRIGARTHAGTASPALRQIIGAILARPGIEPEKWEAAVRNTVANPPEWVRGDLQIGHVFGEKAAEWALANRGRVTEKNEDPGYQARVDDFRDAMASFQSGE